MPWTPKDALKHTKKANTPALQDQWAAVANNVLARTGDEAKAIRQANATIDRNSGSTPPMTDSGGPVGAAKFSNKPQTPIYRHQQAQKGKRKT